MVSLRRRRYLVMYPEYFDKNRTRKQGRRVPLEKADDAPTLKKLVKACEILGYQIEVEPDKAHPSNWWNRQGRVLIKVDKNDKKPKEELIKEITKILKKLVPKKKKKPVKEDDKATAKSTSKGGRTAKSRKGTKPAKGAKSSKGRPISNKPSKKGKK